MCQYFVQELLEITRRQLPQSITYRYMDDILMTDSDVDKRRFYQLSRIQDRSAKYLTTKITNWERSIKNS